MFHAGAATAAAQPPRPSSPSQPPPVSNASGGVAAAAQPRAHTPSQPPPPAYPPPGGATPQPFGAPQGSGPHPYSAQPPHMQQPPMQQPPHMQQPPPGSPYAPGAQQMPYSPHPPVGAMQPPYPMPGRKSNTGMLIGIGVGVLAVAGIIIGIVVAKSGGGGYGAGSKDDAIKETLAALSGGDIDKLMKLGGPDNMSEAFLDCDRSDKGGADYGRGSKNEDKEERERMKKKFQEAIDMAKGLKLEYVDAKEDREPKKMEKGDKTGENCKLKVDVTLHRLEVKVKVSKGDKPAREQKADIKLIEVDGRWLVERAPKLSFGPDCAGAIAHMIMLSRDEFRRANLTDTTISKLEDKLVSQCGDESWSEEAVQCMADATVDRDTMRCMDKLNSSQRERMMRALVDSMSGTSGGGGGISPPPPRPIDDPPPPTTTGSVPAACQDYKRAIEEAIACDKIPESSRDSLRKSLEGMTKLWADYPTMPQASQDSIQRMCREGTEAMRRVAKSSCP
jgi:hypothetical protein